MKEHPILFSAPMIRAIIAGRKTQTRRIIKPQPAQKVVDVEKRNGKTVAIPYWQAAGLWNEDKYITFPFGNIGDILWVRERLEWEGEFGWQYAADHTAIEITGEPHSILFRDKINIPSIHMPRQVSRITLKIVDLRAQRLQDISEKDAKAEGVGSKDTVTIQQATTPTYKKAFEFYWNFINGKKHPWSSNPWVWVISFEKI